MKVILETADLIKIIGAHFGAQFDEQNVSISTEPFEVEVRGIPLPASEKKAKPPGRTESYEPPPEATYADPQDSELVARRADAGATTEPPPPGLDADGLSPADLLRRSQQLEQELDGDAPRQRRGGSARPPADFYDEVS